MTAYGVVLIMILSMLIIYDIFKYFYLIKKDFKKGIVFYSDIAVAVFMAAFFLIGNISMNLFRLHNIITLINLILQLGIYISKIYFITRKDTSRKIKIVFLTVTTILEILALIFLIHVATSGDVLPDQSLLKIKERVV